MNHGLLDRSAAAFKDAAGTRRSRRSFLKLAAGSAALTLAAGMGGRSAFVGRAAAQAQSDQQAQPRPQTVVANGAELSYVEAGRGDPVVFVHGSLNDFRSWGLQLGPFAERYRAIAYSRRYHWPAAATTEDEAVYDATVHADDLAALIEELDLGPVHLVGASYGALVALVLAARRPELARSLVVGEPPLLPWLGQVPNGPQLLADFGGSTWEPARQAFARGDAESGVRAFLDGAVGPGAFDFLPPPVQTMMLDNVPAMKLELETPAETFVSTFDADEAATIQTPTLLLDGEMSPAVFLRITDELAKALPDAERATIPAASHALHAGNPAVYNERVLEFLAKH